MHAAEKRKKWDFLKTVTGMLAKSSVSFELSTYVSQIGYWDCSWSVAT
jgi:hypothetical protein